MAESRLVPCNLMAWPRIRDLLPDQKLIVYHLWATCHEACGCQLVDLGGFQGALNITMPAIRDSFAEFQRRGLLKTDEVTGEVAILDWYRFHKFSSPARRRLLDASVRRIQSKSLKKIVATSMTYALREGKTREGKGISPPAPRGGDGGPSGDGGCLGTGRKNGEKQPATTCHPLDPDIEQIIQDELQGRQEAAARGEAPRITNVHAWTAKLRDRAAAGEDILTEHGGRVRTRREAEARRLAAMQTPPVVSAGAVERGAALLHKVRARRAVAPEDGP